MEKFVQIKSESSSSARNESINNNSNTSEISKFYHGKLQELKESQVFISLKLYIQLTEPQSTTFSHVIENTETESCFEYSFFEYEQKLLKYTNLEQIEFNNATPSQILPLQTKYLRLLLSFHIRSLLKFNHQKAEKFRNEAKKVAKIVDDVFEQKSESSYLDKVIESLVKQPFGMENILFGLSYAKSKLTLFNQSPTRPSKRPKLNSSNSGTEEKVSIFSNCCQCVCTCYVTERKFGKDFESFLDYVRQNYHEIADDQTFKNLLREVGFQTNQITRSDQITRSVPITSSIPTAPSSIKPKIDRGRITPNLTKRPSQQKSSAIDSLRKELRREMK